MGLVGWLEWAGWKEEVGWMEWPKSDSRAQSLVWAGGSQSVP